MARLPISGSDEGTWGSILNDYLSVTHKGDGTLKPASVNNAAVQDGAITDAKLATGSGSNGQVLTKNSGASGGLTWSSASGAADATTTSKGIVQLAGDLAGTAATPTVPGLASKANASTTISAGTGLSGGGDLSTNRTISASFGTTAGTIAQGNDSRITGAVQATLADAKGDLLAASAADTITRLAVGANGQVLSANSAQATGVHWVTPGVGGLADTYPLSAIGAFAASCSLDGINGAGTFGAAFFVRIFVPAHYAITSVGMQITGAGTLGAGGENSFGVYDDSGTFVASTPSDNNLWSSTGWSSASFATPIAAQTTDRFVYVSPLVNGYSAAPSTLYRNNTHAVVTQGIGFNVKRRAFFQGTLAAWPASIDPATYGSDAGGFIPFIALA